MSSVPTTMPALRALCLLLLLLTARLANAAAVPTITVGWDDYPPYQMHTEGAQRGIDMDIVSAMLVQAGFAVRFQKLPWARQLFLLRTGDLDIAMNASRSPERAEFADWTEPYRAERVALISLASNTLQIQSLRDLLGYPIRIGVIRDSVYAGEYTELLRDPTFRQMLEFTPMNLQNLKKLRSNRIDYLIDDPVTIQYQAQQNAGLPIRIALELTGDETRFMVSRKTLAKHPEALTKLNAALAKLKHQGKLREIYTRYGINH